MSQWQRLVDRWFGPAIVMIVLGTLAVRVAAWLVLGLPVESDAAAYLSMAQSIVHTGVPSDTFGQHGFYSIGYPLFLVPFVAILGATPLAALSANLVLTLGTVTLLWKLAQRLRLPPSAVLAVLVLYTVWIPGIWNAAGAARENLSTPLLLLVLLTSLWVLDRRRGALPLAGVVCGAAMLAGGSALLLGLAPLLALRCRSSRLRHRDQWMRGAAAFAGGALIMLLPWLLAMQAMTGSFTLNTSSGFNFYLGHNPAATGGFVSISDTPAGPRWQALHARAGEAGAAQQLTREGLAFVAENPLRTAELAAIKLWRFWAPNVPDAQDFAASATVAYARYADVALYLAILLLGLIGLFWPGRLTREERLVIGALILGFWAVHTLAYVMPRYRDPVVPVFMLLALLPFCRRDGVRV